MTDDIQAAAERLRRCAALRAEGDSCWISRVYQPDPAFRPEFDFEADKWTVICAYRALGERHTEARFGVHNPTTGRLLQPFTTQSGAESFIKENRVSDCSVVRVVTFLSPVDTKGTT